MVTGKILLLVDDDQDDREMLEMQLKKMDDSFQIFAAIDGQDALQTLEEKMTLPPDLIFLDINMPRMDGKQFLKVIKKDTRFRDIPIVIYTTSRSENDINETKNLGAAYYFSKPNNLMEFMKSLITIFHLIMPPPSKK